MKIWETIGLCSAGLLFLIGVPIAIPHISYYCFGSSYGPMAWIYVGILVIFYSIWFRDEPDVGGMTFFVAICSSIVVHLLACISFYVVYDKVDVYLSEVPTNGKTMVLPQASKVEVIIKRSEIQAAGRKKSFLDPKEE